MIENFVNWQTLIAVQRMMQEERNYDAEYRFIEMMDYFNELVFDNAIVFQGEDGDPIGMNFIMIWHGENDNDHRV